MQYQTFRGADVKQALEAIKASLGPDALIGATTRVKHGGPGALGTSYVEIAAAPPLADRTNWQVSDLNRKGVPGRTTKTHKVGPAQRITKPASLGNDPGALRLDAAEVERELRTLRAMIEDLAVNRPPRERALAMLQAVGLEGTLARQLAVGAPKTGRGGMASLRAWLSQRIGERLKVEPRLIEREGPQLIACVGPSGVGKTTTLAKLAARARLDLGRPVRVICLDSYRVGAVEQWQRYAKLMGLPLHVVTEPDEYRELVCQCKSELVLVDTAGMSSNEPAVNHLLESSLGAAVNRPKHVLLVLPAWMRARDSESVVDRYRALAPTGLVVSKVDETHQRGGVLHAALPTGYPIAYLCDGPRVPEDVRDATIDTVIQTVFPDET